MATVDLAPARALMTTAVDSFAEAKRGMGDFLRGVGDPAVSRESSLATLERIANDVGGTLDSIDGARAAAGTAFPVRTVEALDQAERGVLALAEYVEELRGSAGGMVLKPSRIHGDFTQAAKALDQASLHVGRPNDEHARFLEHLVRSIDDHAGYSAKVPAGVVDPHGDPSVLAIRTSLGAVRQNLENLNVYGITDGTGWNSVDPLRHQRGMLQNGATNASFRAHAIAEDMYDGLEGPYRERLDRLDHILGGVKTQAQHILDAGAPTPITT